MRWVRAIISMMAMGGIIYGFVKEMITPSDFLIVAGGAIAWWYTSRDKEKMAGNGTTTTTPPAK